MHHRAPIQHFIRHKNVQEFPFSHGHGDVLYLLRKMGICALLNFELPTYFLPTYLLHTVFLKYNWTHVLTQAMILLY